MSNAYWERFARDRIGRRRLLKTGGSLSLGMASLGLVGCGSDDPEDSSPTSAATSAGDQPSATTAPNASGQPVRGGVLGTHITSQSGNYNIANFYHHGYQNFGIIAYDRPITARLDNRRYVLEAAEKLELAEPTKLVMTLNPDMVYHNQEPVNGRAVKASDIVATQQYVAQLPNAENSGFQRNYMESVEAPDDRTVVFNLKSPSAYLFASVYMANPTAQMIIPEEMLPGLDDTPPIGSGPYELESHTLNAEYKYKRFENFRTTGDGMPYFDGRETVVLIDPVAQETAFRSGRLHYWQPPAATVDRLLSELDEAEFANASFLAVGLVGFNAMMNVEKGGPRPWNDVRVREAIYRLTNRQQWIDLVYDGKGVVPTGPIHASLEVYQLAANETEEYYKEDIAEAKKLLEAANYDINQEWECICINTGVNAQLGEVWQQQLARGDFKIRVEPLPFAVHNPERVFPAKFDLFIGGQPGGDTPYRALRNQHSDTGDQFTNVGLYEPDIDALIEQSEQTSDPDENVRLVKEIQLEALKRYSLSYISLTAQTYAFLDARLQNWEFDPLSGQNFELAAWFKA